MSENMFLLEDSIASPSGTDTVPTKVFYLQQRSTYEEADCMANATLVPKAVFHLQQDPSYRVFHLSRLYCMYVS